MTSNIEAPPNAIIDTSKWCRFCKENNAITPTSTIIHFFKRFLSLIKEEPS
jgi:hypothetical protein